MAFYGKYEEITISYIYFSYYQVIIYGFISKKVLSDLHTANDM